MHRALCRVHCAGSTVQSKGCHVLGLQALQPAEAAEEEESDEAARDGPS